MVNFAPRPVKHSNVSSLDLVTNYKKKCEARTRIQLAAQTLPSQWVESMTRASTPEDTFRVSEDDEEYIQMLREEEEFWDSRAETLLSMKPRPAAQRYVNERFTGDPDKLWYEVIGDEGEFTNGCAFGAGPGKVEESLLRRHPQLRLTIFDISGDALARLQTRLDGQFPGRAETRKQDLNFVDLQSEAYDLAVANSSIHHLVNLEHVAFQVNRSLTPDGRFFMADAIEESYFQFAEEKKRIFEMFHNATRDASEPGYKMDWPSRDNWKYSPFESVRSGDILEVFERYLLPLRVKTSGALLAMELFMIMNDSRGRIRSALERLRTMVVGRRLSLAHRISRGELLYLLDGLLCDSGRLVPGTAFGIYGKRGG